MQLEPPIIAIDNLLIKPVTKVHNPAAGNRWKSQGFEFQGNEFVNIFVNDFIRISRINVHSPIVLNIFEPFLFVSFFLINGLFCLLNTYFQIQQIPYI